MGLRIRTNIAALNVQKYLQEVTKNENDELSKLASGKRIAKAADDAAGLAIATNLDARTKGLRQATRNANDGISFVQTAEGGLNEISNILIRLRELTIQSSSDTVKDVERDFLNREYDALISEVDRIAKATSFNGYRLLSGEVDQDVLDFQVGASKEDYNVIQFQANETNVTSDELGIDGTTVAEKDDALDSIGVIDEAIEKVSGQRANLGALQSRLGSCVSNLESQTITQEGAKSMIEDVDYAKSSAELASHSVVKQAAIATLAQANTMPLSALKLI